MPTNEGWGFLDTLTGGTLSAHYFTTKGESLCRRWLALGTPRYLLNQDTPATWVPPQKFRRSLHCKGCWTKRRDAELRAAEGKMIAEHGVPS